MPPANPSDKPAETWAAVDACFAEGLGVASDDPRDVLEANAKAGLPAIDVSYMQARFLNLLARARSARRILEVGTLGGYSTIWLARALPAESPAGSLVTLELEPHHAATAKKNFERHGVAPLIDVRVGDALTSLATLEQQVASGEADRFDLAFIDADKANNGAYFKHAVRLANDGAVIIVDNVVRGGAVADPASEDPSVRGVHALMDAIRDEPRVAATTVQTVGSKGYDGFVMAVVNRA